MKGTDAKHVWVCPCCWEYHLDRYGHEAVWEERDDGSDGFCNEDGVTVGDDEFGLCVICFNEEATLGQGLFLENHTVEYEFTESGILYTTIIPT